MSKIKITDYLIIFKDSGMTGKIFMAAFLCMVAVFAMNSTGFNPVVFPLILVVVLPFFFKDEMMIYPAEDRMVRRSGFRGKKVKEISLDAVDCITIKTIHKVGQLLLNVDYVAEIHFKGDQWPAFEYGRLPDRQHILPITKLIGALTGIPVLYSDHCTKFYENIDLPVAEHSKPKPGEKLPLDQIAKDKWLKRYIKRS